MFNKIGLCRLNVTVPLFVRPEVDVSDLSYGEITKLINKSKVLCFAMATLTIEPKDSANVSGMNPETVKAKLTKDLCIEDYYKLRNLFQTIAKDYNANRVFLNLLVGFNYKANVYPVSMTWEFHNDRMKKQTMSVAIPSDFHPSKYTVDIQVNTSEFIWFEDIIDSVIGILDASEGKKPIEIAKKVTDYSYKIPGVRWFNATVIRGNFISVCERKV